MRRAEDLCASAEKRWSARYTGFLSDREQDLCAAALNRVGCDWYRFDGGYDGAERKLLCLAPFGIECEPPIRFVKVAYSHLCAQPPAHRDCLGAILGLAVERSCIGDLIPSPDEHCIYVAVLQEMAGVLCRELRQAGRVFGAHHLVRRREGRSSDAAAAEAADGECGLTALGCRSGGVFELQPQSSGGICTNWPCGNQPHSPREGRYAGI